MAHAFRNGLHVDVSRGLDSGVAKVLLNVLHAAVLLISSGTRTAQDLKGHQMWVDVQTLGNRITGSLKD
jgi:hypothetical protein